MTGIEPMFPLGNVLVPGAHLPLRVFEPRYRQMMADCRRVNSGFGVVLIERGSEVGGGDHRAEVGCRSRILAAEETPDGQWAVLAEGTERIRVTEWLADDPYPRAHAEPWPDPAEDEAWAESEAGATARDGLARQITELVRLAMDQGRVGPEAEITLSDDPVRATWEAVALGPLGPADRYAVLSTESAGVRAALAADLLDGQLELFRLDWGTG